MVGDLEPLAASVSSRRKTAMALKPRMIVRSVGSPAAGSVSFTLRAIGPRM
jgi:hypothetical protein